MRERFPRCRFAPLGYCVLGGTAPGYIRSGSILMINLGEPRLIVRQMVVNIL